VELGSYEGYDLGFVEVGTGEPGDVATGGIGDEKGMDAGEESEGGVGCQHVLGGVGPLGHLIGYGDGYALGEAEGAWMVGEHVELAVVDEEIGAEEAIDAGGELVEGLSVDIVFDFGDAGLIRQPVDGLDEVGITGNGGGFVGEDGPGSFAVGVLREIEELFFDHVVVII